MCVAVVVLGDRPTNHELREMHESNPHGAGIAWGAGNLVRYRKGLTWSQCVEILDRVPRPALLHFRWATHGPKVRYLTHPFPIGAKALKSRKLNSAAQAVLIHNGVWHEYESYAPYGIDLNKWSDTAVAAYAVGEYGDEILDHVPWCTAIGRMVDGELDVTIRGNWQEYGDNMYSNLTWQSWKPKYRISDFDDTPTNPIGLPYFDSYGDHRREMTGATQLDLLPANDSEFEINKWVEEYLNRK